MNEVNLIHHLLVCCHSFRWWLHACVIWFIERGFIRPQHKNKVGVSMWERQNASVSSTPIKHMCMGSWAAAKCWLCPVLYFELPSALLALAEPPHPKWRHFFSTRVTTLRLRPIPPLGEPTEQVPRVGVGVESRPFSLSVGCYWWGEVMGPPHCAHMDAADKSDCG